MKPVIIHGIQTEIFRQGESLSEFICKSVANELIQENLILAVTSKIVSLAEKRIVKRGTIDKVNLVKQEADMFLGEIGHGCFLTIKESLLIPSAGIDESNSESGDFILYPIDPTHSAKNLWIELRQKWNLDQLGIILTDSHTTPLRRGVTGICLSYYGFDALQNMIGTQDLFGRELKMTQVNFADALATAAVMVMGEGAESRPLALIENAQVKFSLQQIPKEIEIPLQEDLYYPMLKPLIKPK